MYCAPFSIRPHQKTLQSIGAFLQRAPFFVGVLVTLPLPQQQNEQQLPSSLSQACMVLFQEQSQSQVDAWPIFFFSAFSAKTAPFIPGASRRCVCESVCPNLKMTEIASWSLPPLPSFSVLTIDLLSALLKTLSTPPKTRPEYTCNKWLRNSCRSVDARLELKSPTKIIVSPCLPLSLATFSKLCAVVQPPHLPPELTERAPW
mmetsp:Transcript_19415/g.37384  ORF Transcript_19415/g.37384 Transcript_19415/m.37384 type:complete len:203 (-) Transcript_19415:694-1302(-)